MRRRIFLAACSAGVAGLAGCPGGTGTASDGGTGDASDAGNETETPTPTAATETTTVPDENVVDYSTLSPAAREAFERAQNGTVRFGHVPGIEKTIHYNLSTFTPFRDHEYVRKAGTLYVLSTDRSGFIGGRRVSVESVDTVGNESVVRLGDRTGEGVELIERAIETDGDAARIRVTLPDSITPGDVVRYRGEHYRLTSVQTVDYEYFALTVEKRP
jgi:hypothetical protein